MRYQLGRLFAKYGYKVIRDYKFPDVHADLLQLGFELLKTKLAGPIQLVQVGAFDGTLADPLERILGDDRVAAVLVEPQATPFGALVKRYSTNPRIRLVNGVVAATDGTATLFVPDTDASPKASLNPRHYRRFGGRGASVREIQVPSLAVATLLRQYALNPVNTLQLDTEGMDFEILRWFLAAEQKPELINFESLHLSKSDRLDSRKSLRKNCYWYIETEQDTFAIRESLISRV